MSILGINAGILIVGVVVNAFFFGVGQCKNSSPGHVHLLFNVEDLTLSV